MCERASFYDMYCMRGDCRANYSSSTLASTPGGALSDGTIQRIPHTLYVAEHICPGFCGIVSVDMDRKETNRALRHKQHHIMQVLNALPTKRKIPHGETERTSRHHTTAK